MKTRIHRGTSQIDGTCIELAHEGTRIVLDLGLVLDGDADDQLLLAAISVKDLVAAFTSDPHFDHYGLLHHL